MGTKKNYQKEKNIKKSLIFGAIRKKRSSEVVNRLILEFEEFIEDSMGNSNSKPKSLSSDKKKIKELKGRIASLEYYITTVNGLWAIDRDPKQVTKKFIEEHAFQIDIEL